MMSDSPLSEAEQFQALNVLEYLSDLFTASGKQSFTKAEVLVILNSVQGDQNIFDPHVLIAQQEASAEIDPLPS